MSGMSSTATVVASAPVPDVVGMARCGRSGDGGLRPSPTGGLTFTRLDAKGQQDYAAAMEKLWDQHNEIAGGGTRVRAEYLEVIATRA